MGSPADVLLEAHALITGARRAKYGRAADDFARAVNAFNALTGHNLEVWEGPLFLMLVKASREVNTHDADNARDAAGYWGLVHEIREGA